MFALLNSSFVDYPQKITAVAFLYGCNLRCPFCHNKDLVLGAKEQNLSSIADLEKLLDSKNHILDALCISGGEPLLNFKETFELAKLAKAKNKLVKIDTNGFFPEELLELSSKNLVDYVALDIKSSPQRYPLACGNSDIDLSKLEKTINILKQDIFDYEFRTTVVPNFFDQEIALAILNWLKSGKRYVFQQFNPRADMIDAKQKEQKPFSKETVEKYTNQFNQKFSEVLFKGFS